MDDWLTKSRDQFQTEIFDFLWRQWSTLGVAGVTQPGDERIIDPEALLLFSLSICRYEPRLFDEILDWLVKSGHFINVQRMRQIQKKYNFNCGPQLSAVAKLLSHNAKHRLKWSGLMGQYVMDPSEPLFVDKQGEALPCPSDEEACPEFMAHGLRRGRLSLRGYSQSFDPQHPACLLLRMRALMGMHARAEIICLLAAVNEIHPAEAARQTCYYQKTIQTALLEMAQSGAVVVRRSQGAKFYRLESGLLDRLLKPNNKMPQWIHWPSVLRSIEMIWQGLHRLGGMQLESILLASELRKLLRSTSEDCLHPEVQKLDVSRHIPPEDLPQHFRVQLKKLIRFLNPESE